MADEKCVKFPRRVSIDTVSSVLTNYGNKAPPEMKELTPIINAMLEALLTGRYAGEQIIPTNPGGDGTITLSLVAGENLAAGNVVVIKTNGMAYKADNQDASQYELQAGIVTSAYASGGLARIICYGEAVFSGWNLQTGNEIYVTSGGGLSATVPSTGMVWVIGRSIGSTAILVAPEKPVQL